MDGLSFFLKNVTSHFEGVAECAICYSCVIISLLLECSGRPLTLPPSAAVPSSSRAPQCRERHGRESTA